MKYAIREKAFQFFYFEAEK